MYKESIMAVYYGLFHSRLEYAILAWGHSPHAEKVFKIQRRVVRVIANRGYQEDCRSDFVELQIPTLYSTYAYKCAILACEHLAEGKYNLPAHTHSTRFATGQNIQHPCPRTTRARNSRNYWAPKIFNGLPEGLKDAMTNLSPGHTKKLREHFINKTMYGLGF